MARTDSLIALAMCLCVKQNTRSCNKNIYSNYRFSGIMSSYTSKIISCSLYSVFLFMQLVFCLAVRQKESRPSWAQHWEDVNSFPSGLFLTYQYWGWFCEKHENYRQSSMVQKAMILYFLLLFILTLPLSWHILSPHGALSMAEGAGCTSLVAWPLHISGTAETLNQGFIWNKEELKLPTS